jgi:hypothetical protein
VDDDDAGVVAVVDDSRRRGRVPLDGAFERLWRAVPDLEELEIPLVGPRQQFTEDALTRGGVGPLDERIVVVGDPELEFGQRVPGRHAVSATPRGLVAGRTRRTVRSHGRSPSLPSFASIRV